VSAGECPERSAPQLADCGSDSFYLRLGADKAGVQPDAAQVAGCAPGDSIPPWLLEASVIFVIALALGDAVAPRAETRHAIEV
jgi:hypothetical protein